MQTALLRIPALAAILCSSTFGFEDSEEILQRFLKRVRTDLDRLPNLVCTQEVERFRRSTSEQPWKKWDTFKLEVAAIGDQELYARVGERSFSKSLAELVGRGTIGSGQFANLARQVFGGHAVKFEYKGETEQEGTPALEYTFDVPADRSGYKLRAGTAEAVVAFQGAFRIARSTLDLLALEVQTYDIPDKLGIAEADTAITYARVSIDNAEVLLPRVAMLTILATDGVADMNRSRVGACRQYGTESTLKFDNLDRPDAKSSPASAEEAAAAVAELPDRALFDLALEAPLHPSAAALGDAIAAKLLNPIKDGNVVVVPQGARVTGRIVRLEKHDRPFPVYEIGLEFTAATVGERVITLVATMVDAGPEKGLIRQSRRLEPTFTRQRGARMDILVREVQQGQGILTWDAKRGALPAGLKMRWRLADSMTRQAGPATGSAQPAPK